MPALVFADPSTDWHVLPDSASWARPLYTLADSAGLAYGIATTPFASVRGEYLVSEGSGFTYEYSSGGARPPVEFGVELNCGECGWRGGGRPTFATAVFPVIESVEKDGPADQAGLLPGDVMFAVEGSPITSTDAGRRLGALKPGESVTLEIRRGDRIVELSITPRESSRRRQRM
jgi:membrane-associated protease RseP (regulator of RpoE activity)